jgi:LacI family transcriptional regulator
MQITLKELAAKAGVHPSTISRIVNKDPALRVSSATRARIESLLRETEYRPDAVARSLRMQQSYVLAMIIPDITNPLFANIFMGVEDVAIDSGYDLILGNTGGLPERELRHLRGLQARRVDGILLASVYLRDPSVQWLRKHRIRHVLVNRYSDERDPFVGSDDVAGAKLATRHLIELGHRRIAHLAGADNISTAVLRKKGYLEALKEAGITPDPRLIVQAGYLEESGHAAMAKLLELRRRPTAVFAVNDMAAIGAHGLALELGLRIPEDLAIVGYNDVPDAARLSPGLTTVRVRARELGRTAGKLLIEQVESARDIRRRNVLEPELIVRGSTVAGSGKG